jgi:histidine triad (HIT) family protein
MQKDCIFCKIAAKEIPVEIVYEDEYVLAFPDINPAAPVHVLVIPKTHIDNILTAQPEDMPSIAHVMAVIPKIAAKMGIAEDGFRIVVNTRDNGGQTVYHMHWHILGGRFMAWPPG